MQFLIQVTLLTHFFGLGGFADKPHEDVFHEFGQTLLSLLEAPSPKARIRAVSFD